MLADTTAETTTSVKPRIKAGVPSTLVNPFLSLLLLAAAMAVPLPQNSTPPVAAKPRTGEPVAVAGEIGPVSAARIFQQGEDALKRAKPKDLVEAEHDFRQVLAMDPRSGAAYANLGVVYMRRKQWSKALETLRKAEHLLPQVAGIRLNIGL